MEFRFVKRSQEGRVAILTLSRPEALNALNSETLRELDGAIEQLENDNTVDAVIITGEGKAFVAGADIAQMKDLGAEEGRKFGALGQKVFRRIELLEKPVIAAINGFALGGGCELSLSCDMRIASERAKLGQPEVTLGIIPGFSGTQRLARLIGVAKAKELIFTGDMIDAKEAARLGLVNKVVAPEDLMTEAMTLANKIIAKAPLAVRYAKIAINRGIETDIETGIEIEADLFALCFATEDQKEGMGAFVEKRKATFVGK